jgi:hypothetical protein
VIEVILSTIATDSELAPYLKRDYSNGSQFPHISIDHEERMRPRDDMGIETISLKLSVWTSVRHYFEADRISQRVENLILGITDLGIGRLILMERVVRDAGPVPASGAWRVQLTFRALIEN